MLTNGARAKIFGLNAAQVYGVDPQALRCVIREDDLTKLRMAHRSDPRSVPVPDERYYGPRTRRELLAFLRWESFSRSPG